MFGSKRHFQKPAHPRTNRLWWQDSKFPAFSKCLGQSDATKSGACSPLSVSIQIHIARREHFPTLPSVLRKHSLFVSNPAVSFFDAVEIMSRSNTSYHTAPSDYDTFDDYYSNLPATSPDLRSRTGEPGTWPPTSKPHDPKVSERARRYVLSRGEVLHPFSITLGLLLRADFLFEKGILTLRHSPEATTRPTTVT